MRFRRRVAGLLALLGLVIAAGALSSACLRAGPSGAAEDDTRTELKAMAQGERCDLDFWVFGSVRPDQMPLTRELGFVGVGYWGADRDGDRIKYYFESPTLSQVDWAERVTQEQGESRYSYAGRAVQGAGLAGYAERAHAAGLKVMVNMEGVNPYHWEAGREKWTPEIISGVARDLHAQGADRWFTECVAGWPRLMEALAATAREIGMEYQEGDDPSYLHGFDSDRAGSFPDLYRQASVVSMYHYHYRRDEEGKYASLAQEGSLPYGFARAWGVPRALVYTVGHNWGEDPEDWEGILKATILIRALQFRVRDIMLIGVNEEKARALGIPGTKQWVGNLVAKNAAEGRPLLNVVVHLRKGPGTHWRDFAASGDAITSGAFHAGYDVACSTSPLPEADAYYVYTAGADGEGVLDLTDEIAALFASGKPVFLQVGFTVPSGSGLTQNWRKALAACGVDPAAGLAAGEMPAEGVYRGSPIKYTGVFTAYGLTARRGGTLLPPAAVTGQVLAEGDGVPLLVGRGKNYLLPANCLSWQMMWPISDLLSGGGVRASSDVWGIVGSKATALLAIHDTQLEMTIPGLTKGARLRVTQWDRRHRKVSEDVLTYAGSLSRPMRQFDLIVAEAGD